MNRWRNLKERFVNAASLHVVVLNQKAVQTSIHVVSME